MICSYNGPIIFRNFFYQHSCVDRFNNNFSNIFKRRNIVSNGGGFRIYLGFAVLCFKSLDDPLFRLFLKRYIP